MQTRTRRHLELLDLARPLQRYARSLDADPNASSFLVHQALAAAFSQPDLFPAGQDLEASLRLDIARTYALAERDANLGPILR